MTQPHPTDVPKDNNESHPVRLAIGIFIGAIALVVGIMLLAQFAVGAYGTRSMKDDAAMSPDAVKKRLAPVGRVEVDPKAPPPAPAAPATAATPVAAAAIPPPSAQGAPAAASGKTAYDATCSACHAAGIAGAPKLGDKAAWAPRLKQGKDVLHANALKGKGAMPPKGGNLTLADADVKAAVDYLLDSVK